MTTQIQAPRVAIESRERAAGSRADLSLTVGRGLPTEARAGLERAWLDSLRDRHPEVAWVIQLPTEANAVASQAKPPDELEGAQ